MRMPKDRHADRVTMEPNPTSSNSLLSDIGVHPSIQRVALRAARQRSVELFFIAAGGLSKLRATSSRSERGRDRHAAAAAQVHARRLRQAASNVEQQQSPQRRTRSGPAATLKELQLMAELYEAGDQPLLALVSIVSYCAHSSSVSIPFTLAPPPCVLTETPLSLSLSLSLSLTHNARAFALELRHRIDNEGLREVSLRAQWHI